MRRYATLCLALLLPCSLFGYEWEWQTYTSMYRTTSMCGDGQTVWCGTEGGLYAFDPQDLTFTMWTGTEGLASIDVTALSCDTQGRIWIGFQDGCLQRYDPASSAWFRVDDFEGHPIHCLFLQSDTLYVGLDIGVSVYLVSREEVKETYRRLGQFQVDIPVRDILVVDGEIWAATDEGLAHASLSSVNLLDPESWSNVTTADGLPENLVASITVWNDAIVAATEDGVSAETDGAWTLMNTGFLDDNALDLVVHEDQLYVVTPDGCFRWSGQAWQMLGDGFADAKHLLSHGADLWVGTDNGIRRFDEDGGTWHSHTPDTPASNRFIDLALDAEGTLWCASSAADGQGFSHYDGSTWTVYNRSVYPDFPSDAAVSVVVDNDDNKWVGTHGGGIIVLKNDETFCYYNAQNDSLSGIRVDPAYVVVWDMVVDPASTLWILNLDARNNLPIIAVDADSRWTRYGTSSGFTTGDFKTVAVDDQGRKWFGSYGDNAQGIFILDDGGTPSDLSDDPPLERLTTVDGLETNRIQILAKDHEGGMWIGTPSGLHYAIGGTVTRRYGLPSESIAALAVDGADNLWVGTDAGLSLFSTDTFTWQHFTTDNSDLVNNSILSLLMDPSTGHLYIGTEHGLSRLATPFSEPGDQLVPLRVYPNPFLPNQHAQLVVDELARDVSVHIFSSSGFPVRSYSQGQVQGRRLLWDGKNDSGQVVASGIYVIVATASNGERVLAKVAVVR